MGLYDGASGRGELASTAHVAKLLRAPVVLVVDAAAMARSVAAIVHGYASFDPEVEVRGVILNRVGSDAHAGLSARGARAARDRGARRDPARRPRGDPRASSRAGARRRARASGSRRDRPAGRGDRRLVRRRRVGGAGPLGCGGTRRRVDAARRRTHPPTRPGSRSPAVPRSASATRRTSSCCAPPAPSWCEFDPLEDEQLPPRTAALLLTGGFPEVYGEQLSENWALRAEIAALARAGRPVLAECGGLLYLCTTLDGRPMCDVIDADAR